mgnify:CR=1 FL=1
MVTDDKIPADTAAQMKDMIAAMKVAFGYFLRVSLKQLFSSSTACDALPSVSIR